MDINIHVIRFLQRTIELLAFYLILANLDGKDLKESFIQLFKTKQKRLYGNVVFLVIYLLGITYALHIAPDRELILFIDGVARPFIAFFLLRRIFSLKKALLTNLFSMGIVIIIGIFSLIFSLQGTPVHGLLVFLLILVIVMMMAHQNYFENIYVRLLKKRQLFNIVSIISFIIYLVFLIPSGLYSISFIIIIYILLTLLSFLVAAIYLRSEVRKIIDQLQNVKRTEFLELLKSLSAEYYEEPDLIHQYLIRNYNFMDIYPPLLKALSTQKMLNTIKDYECVITKRQIKINVLL